VETASCAAAQTTKVRTRKNENRSGRAILIENLPITCQEALCQLKDDVQHYGRVRGLSVP
jgi:hypothetical protein